jgi:uncharacterized protein (DUF427 family)
VSIFPTRPEPDPVGPNQESVWAYPRPPALEPVTRRLRVVLGGEVIAESTRAWRVLETSHPPNYYLPLDAVAAGALERTTGASFCEFKGRAHYYTVTGGGVVANEAAWAYDAPSPAFESLRDHVAFYASRMDACFVDDERVIPQPGGFYGGWITADVAGPFKGAPGTRGW